MSYEVGYKFKVSATRNTDGTFRLAKLYSLPYKQRIGNNNHITLSDDIEVVVLEYNDGRLFVDVPSLCVKGYLG